MPITTKPDTTSNIHVGYIMFGTLACIECRKTFRISDDTLLKVYGDNKIVIQNYCFYCQKPY